MIYQKGENEKSEGLFVFRDNFITCLFLNMVFAKEGRKVITRDKAEIMRAIKEMEENRIQKIYKEKDVRDVTLEHLFKEADCVVMGKVRKVEVKKVPQTLYKIKPEPIAVRSHTLRTFVTISPSEWLKTFPELKNWFLDSKDILVTFKGGTMQVENGLTREVSVLFKGGAPRFKEGQKVLLFLIKGNPPHFGLFWSARGQYVIENGEIYNLSLGKEKSLVSLESFLKEIEKIKGGEK